MKLRWGLRRIFQCLEAFVKSILDRSFRYTNSVETDLRKTFARIRREQRVREQAVAVAEAESLNKIRPIRQKVH